MFLDCSSPASTMTSLHVENLLDFEIKPDPDAGMICLYVCLSVCPSVFVTFTFFLFLSLFLYLSGNNYFQN